MRVAYPDNKADFARDCRRYAGRIYVRFGDIVLAFTYLSHDEQQVYIERWWERKVGR